MAGHGHGNRNFMPLAKTAPQRLRWTLFMWTWIPAVLPAMAAVPAPAQRTTHHYFHGADMAPGVVGQGQLMRGGPLPGHFQAVEISAPKGTELSLAMDGRFDAARPAPLKAGLLVGHVYRLRATNIPLREGQEVFPSIEVVNRLYPPPGAQADFPIPIQLTQEELRRALRGQFVVRVIYLEDPRAALPFRGDAEQQRYFEVGPGEDPLEVADGLGRPMAILRIGSRVPDLDQASGRFLFRSPPWYRIPEVTSAPSAAAPDTNAARTPTSGRRPTRSPQPSARSFDHQAGVNR